MNKKFLTLLLLLSTSCNIFTADKIEKEKCGMRRNGASSSKLPAFIQEESEEEDNEEDDNVPALQPKSPIFKEKIEVTGQATLFHKKPLSFATHCRNQFADDKPTNFQPARKKFDDRLPATTGDSHIDKQRDQEFLFEILCFVRL